MKNFLGYIVVSLFSISLLFYSCEKEKNTRICESPVTVRCAQLPYDSTKVNVRLINSTGYPLCNLEVIYETTVGEVVKYGRMENQEYSCFTTYPLRNVKEYPLVSFDLGSRHYVIADTLTNTNRPYGDILLENSGFYSFFVLIADSLNSDTCRTYLQKDF